MSSPKILGRFVCKRKSDGAEFKFVVKEATTANDKEAVLDFLAKYMTPNETFAKAGGIPKNEEAVKEYNLSHGQLYDDSYCMICYEDKESDTYIVNPIVAINLLTSDDKQYDITPEIIAQINHPEIKKVLKIVSVLDELHNTKKKLGFNKFYSGWGLCVRPDYSGMGVAKEMLALRRALCKAHGFPATGAWMTAIGSQKAAERDGWETAFEISSEELGRLADCEFVDAPPTFKAMVGYPDK